MITFEDELGFQSLLQDYEELQKLKTSSYLDTDFLREEKKYRVHLYYKNNVRRRMLDLQVKYPAAKKTVELDVPVIRVKVDLTNLLSQAINAVEKFGIPQIILPPRGEEIYPVEKKIKTKSSNETVIPTHKKTKSELVIENTNLKVDLRTSLILLSHKDFVISSLQKQLQQVFDWQGLMAGWVEQVVQTLSPTKKSQVEQILAALPKTELFPERRDFEEEKHEKEDKPEIEQLISSNKQEFFFRKRQNSQDKGNEKKSSPNQDKVLEDMFFTFSDHGNAENSKKPSVLENCENYQELLEQSDGEENTSSSFINSSDEGKHREKPQQTTVVEEQPKSQVIKANPRKKQTVVKKESWRDLKSNIITMMNSIKVAIRAGATEEQIKINSQGVFPSNWKKILDPEESIKKNGKIFTTRKIEIFTEDEVYL